MLTHSGTVWCQENGGAHRSVVSRTTTSALLTAKGKSLFVADKNYRSIISDRSFDPETVAMLGAVYDQIIAELGSSGEREVVRKIVAKRIIDSTSRGERDPGRLRAAALLALGDKVLLKNEPTNSSLKALAAEIRAAAFTTKAAGDNS